MKRRKPLTKEKYLARFSRAVRWRLPPRDSEEAIADYRELIFREERDEAKLVEELGDPVQAAHLLTDVKTYRRWLKVFAVLAFGLLLLAKWSWMAWATRIMGWNEWWYPVWVMAVGLPLSLYWFRQHEQKDGTMSKWLALALAAVLVFGVGTMALTWYVMSPDFLASYMEKYPDTISWHIILTRELLIEGGIACALLAFVGLVLAKCYDRRWLALYTLGVTTAAMTCFVLFNLVSMDISAADPDVFQAYIFARILPIGAIGLIGTGVALC